MQATLGLTVACALGLLRPALADRHGGETHMIKVGQPELLLTAPDDTTAIFSTATYGRRRGLESVLTYFHERMSDVADESFYRWSPDNGHTWSESCALSAVHDLSAARGIVLPSGPYHEGQRNPFTRERIVLGLSRSRPEGMDPDTPQTYWTQTAMTYALSHDDGRTVGEPRPIIKAGPGFTEQRPFEGLTLGRNQVYGVYQALFLDRGTVLIPLEVSVLAKDGSLYNPHGWDFSQVIVLIGRRSGDGFAWDSAKPIVVDAFKESTRGMNEPTMARLADGRIIMVMRGSNSFIPALLSHKWISVSEDQGRTWSHPRPWTYDDGTAFYSPSSIGQLVSHSSGRLYWFGSICPQKADGNSPRYPLVIGEVDLQTGLLKRSTVTTIADRAPDQDARIQFSNFSVYEDRRTREFVLDVTHFYPSGKPNRRGTGDAWTGNVYRYRITP